jgi:hypothetical protein
MVPVEGAVTVAVPELFFVPFHPSTPSPPVAVQTGPAEFQVSVTGASTTAVMRFAEIVVGGGASTVTRVDA